IDAEGVAWGKGLPLTADTREYYRLAKATNARVGTSLAAWAHMDGDTVASLELITVDLADPARVGVPVTAARAHISREMDAITAEDTPQHSAAPTTPLSEPAGTHGGASTVPSVDPLVLELRAERDALRESLRDAALTGAVNQAVRTQAPRSLVLELVRVRNPASPDDIEAAVAAVVESEAVQSRLAAALAGMMGPAQRRPVTRDGASSDFF